MTNGLPDATLTAIGQLLGDRTGIDAALLTAQGLSAIVSQRTRALGVDIDDYRGRIEHDNAELVRLASLVSVPETWLFRYSASFEYLRDRLMALRATNQTRLEIASLGCAAGAEPWSVAACALSAGWPPGSVIVHALDRSTDAIAAMMTHPLPRSIVRESLPPWAAPWITADRGVAQIAPEVRACVRARCEDFVAQDTGLGAPLDVVLCRNVLIYLSPQGRSTLRQRIVALVGDRGLIMLGHADGMNTDARMDAVGPPSAFAWRRRRIDDESARPMSARARVPVRPEPAQRPSVPLATVPPKPVVSAVTAVREFVAAGELARAHDLVADALRGSPTDLELLELFAGVLAAQDRRREAHEAYRRLVYLQPRHGPALLALAELSLSLGDAAEAARYRLRAHRVDE